VAESCPPENSTKALSCATVRFTGLLLLHWPGRSARTRLILNNPSEQPV